MYKYQYKIVKDITDVSEDGKDHFPLEVIEGLLNDMDDDRWEHYDTQKYEGNYQLITYLFFRRLINT